MGCKGVYAFIFLTGFFFSRSDVFSINKYTLLLRSLKIQVKRLLGILKQISNDYKKSLRFEQIIEKKLETSLLFC